MSIKNIFNTQISTNIKERALFYYLQAMLPLIFFLLLSKTFLYWADISGTWAKTFFIPDLYSAHTKKCETFNFNVLFIFDLTLDVTKLCTF